MFQDRAKLKFYHACMMSGKTAYLVNTFDIYQRKGLSPVVIKPCIDDREGSNDGWGETASRLMPDKKIPAYYFKDLRKELPRLDYGSILVDEAQFMTRDDVEYLAAVVDRQQIPVIAYGLKNDVSGKLFEGSAALLALADEVQEIESVCQNENCQEKAQSHLRFVDGKLDKSGTAVAIEKGNVTYMSVCRQCWRNLMGER